MQPTLEGTAGASADAAGSASSSRALAASSSALSSSATASAAAGVAASMAGSARSKAAASSALFSGVVALLAVSSGEGRCHAVLSALLLLVGDCLWEAWGGDRGTTLLGRATTLPFSPCRCKRQRVLSRRASREASTAALLGNSQLQYSQTRSLSSHRMLFSWLLRGEVPDDYTCCEHRRRTST